MEERKKIDPYNPRLEAELLVKFWLQDTGLGDILRGTGKHISELEDRIETLFKKAYRMGQKSPATEDWSRMGAHITLEANSFRCTRCHETRPTADKHICGAERLCPACSELYSLENRP